MQMTKKINKKLLKKIQYLFFLQRNIFIFITLFFGLFYDFLKDGIVGITPLFFLGMYHLSNNNVGFIAANYLNNIWIKFSIVLIFYFMSLFLINFLLEDFSYAIYKNSISVVLSIILFPLFYSLVQKLSVMFGRLND